ncbi:PilT protein domain protein [Rippkaea orientalis PCC 8801]|uniref:Ribonuclease VapC n=1 Tax=Rippkaea orientalis (strain PCC 8801 / RF-1) TaxID=41431 RepID=B7K557_RIPO1|nr:type II toxin-antitoxin system VapC family toxin [Rippkaea orientalis]ACK67883.1 PilT protein domain protein [Rippkaea orientalis PCC 8801]
MIYLLDTNCCIVYLNGRNLILKSRLESHLDSEIAVCSVVKAELFYGSQKSVNTAKSIAKQKMFLRRFISLPFDDNSAEIYAPIRADLERKGTPIGAYDLQIAAIALANNLTLVTHNISEFGRIDRLLYEDWEV